MLILTVSALINAINTKTFINTAGLYPGGAGSLTLLIQRISVQFFGVSLSYAVINILLNAIPVYIGFRYLGRKFTAYSCYNIVLTSILTDIIPNFTITYDILLISVFGGIICGFACVLCLWMEATTGGTDFISIFLSVRKGFDAWNIIFGCNVIILVTAGIVFGWDKALYSIIFQYTFTQVVKTLYRKYQPQTLFILTEHPYEVSQAIYEVSRHGATILNGTGSYEKGKRNIVYSVVSRAETRQIMDAVRKVDPNAFVNSIRTEQLKGYLYQKPIE